MPLPEITRLEAAPPLELRAFAARLRAAGVSLPTVSPVTGAAGSLHPSLRPPIRAFYLRKKRDPTSFALRMFVFHDPVRPDEARAVFPEGLERLLALGLLEGRADGSIVSPFVLSLVDDVLLLSDDLTLGGDAVMGLGTTTTAICRAATPLAPRRRSGAGPRRRALDLGCGAGACAFALASWADDVVATDVNPRAAAMTRINAAMNGLTNVEVRLGSLFEPVAGEVFDRIVSQPPFIPQPEGLAGSTALYGGRRGDELAIELIGRAAPHIAPGGRAVLFMEWPDDGGPPPEQRVREALGADDIAVLVLRAPDASVDEHAVSYAAAIHRHLDDAFMQEAMLRRDHFDRLGIRAVVPTMVVLERLRSTTTFTDVLRVGSFGRIDVTDEGIDRLAAGRVVADDERRLLASRLRVPEGTVLSEEQEGPGADKPSSIFARFAPNGLLEPMVLAGDLLMFLTVVHEADSVREGIAAFAEAYETPNEAAAARLVPAAQRALRAGILELERGARDLLDGTR